QNAWADVYRAAESTHAGVTSFSLMMGKSCVQNQVRNADSEESDSENYPPDTAPLTYGDRI
ncbi:MAG TPA: hypothetical protein VE054_15500, partial [Blattabacteriaceae bacterium]|nr:hypothetical protein [Blattabacteriaceae bacterium]